MVNMQETEVQAYLELVQELLNYPRGAEQDLLAKKPDLVNEKLVETLLTVIQDFTDQNNPEMVSTIEWLIDLTKNLVISLGLNISNVTDKQWLFLLKILELVYDSSGNGNPLLVYPLLEQNLDLLNDGIGKAIKSWGYWQYCQSSTSNRINQDLTAMLIGMFGYLMQEFTLGDKAQNLEISIKCYQLSAQFFTNTNAETWCVTLGRLAFVYSKRLMGDRSKNMEASIDCCRLALKKVTKDNAPQIWADIQNNLAISYSQRILGNIEDNLEIAIACHESALKIRTEKSCQLSGRKLKIILDLRIFIKKEEIEKTI
jgi:hypothetical protein